MIWKEQGIVNGDWFYLVEYDFPVDDVVTMTYCVQVRHSITDLLSDHVLDRDLYSFEVILMFVIGEMIIRIEMSL